MKPSCALRRWIKADCCLAHEILLWLHALSLMERKHKAMEAVLTNRWSRNIYAASGTAHRTSHSFLPHSKIVLDILS